VKVLDDQPRTAGSVAGNLPASTKMGRALVYVLVGPCRTRVARVRPLRELEFFVVLASGSRRLAGRSLRAQVLLSEEFLGEADNYCHAARYRRVVAPKPRL